MFLYALNLVRVGYLFNVKLGKDSTLSTPLPSKIRVLGLLKIERLVTNCRTLRSCCLFHLQLEQGNGEAGIVEDKLSVAESKENFQRYFFGMYTFRGYSLEKR
jgi:hypothetical protein